VYSGILSKTSSLLNTSKNIFEKIQFLYRVRADKYVSVNEVFAGDIIAVSGLKGSGAGDTLINSN
jgi:elongation factor G